LTPIAASADEASAASAKPAASARAKRSAWDAPLRFDGDARFARTPFQAQSKLTSHRAGSTRTRTRQAMSASATAPLCSLAPSRPVPGRFAPSLSGRTSPASPRRHPTWHVCHGNSRLIVAIVVPQISESRWTKPRLSTPVLHVPDNKRLLLQRSTRVPHVQSLAATELWPTACGEFTTNRSRAQRNGTTGRPGSGL